MMSEYDWRSKWKAVNAGGDLVVHVIGDPDRSDHIIACWWTGQTFTSMRLHLSGRVVENDTSPFDLVPVEPMTVTAEQKLEFLKSKGLTVGLATESNKEPYLAYVIEPGSELCDLETVIKLMDAEVSVSSLTAERDRLRALVGRAIIGLKHIGTFSRRCGEDPHTLDCSLAGRVSHVFGTGMTRATELCREFNQDPEFKDESEAAS